MTNQEDRQKGTSDGLGLTRHTPFYARCFSLKGGVNWASYCLGFSMDKGVCVTVGTRQAGQEEHATEVWVGVKMQRRKGEPEGLIGLGGDCSPVSITSS